MSSYLYYIGHSTVYIELGGQSFLTDPLLTRMVSFLRRREPVPSLPDFQDERYTPAVLLSHAHRDHLHVRSLRLVGEDVMIFAPDHAKGLLHKRGFSYAEGVAPGDSFSIGNVHVSVIEADHQGERNGQDVENSAVGYLLDDGERRIYFAGDTDLLPDVHQELGDIDLALLPISGWGPSLGDGHMNPVSAAEQTELLDPKAVVPIHYGPFFPWLLPRSLLVGPGSEDEFFRELYKRGIDQKLQLLEPGSFYSFSETSPSG